MLLIDRFLPSFDFRQVRSLVVRSTRQQTFRAIKELTPAELPSLAWILLVLRGIPARLLRRPYPRLRPDAPILSQMAKSGFLALDEEGEHELVIGVIGQFWRSHGGIHLVSSAEEFLSFDRVDHVVAVMNFIVADGPTPEEVTVSTETRIFIPDESSRTKFRIYWTFVGPGSMLIRSRLLNAIKRRAEHPV
jgi:hypothetical protein